MQNSLFNYNVLKNDINFLEEFARNIDSYSNQEFNDIIARNRILILLAHYAVEKEDVSLLKKLKIKKFSLANNVYIESQNQSPLSWAIKKKHLPSIKVIISLVTEINNNSVNRELNVILEKPPQDIEERELVRNIFNLILESGFVFHRQNQGSDIATEYQDLTESIEINSIFLMDKKIIIDEKKHDLFKNFFQSLTICLKKYDDLDQEIIRGNRDVDKLGDIEINGLKIPVNAFGLKKICDKIFVKKDFQSKLANCFGGVCLRILNRENKLGDFLASSSNKDQFLEVKEKLDHLYLCLKSNNDIANYSLSSNVSRSNSMELRSSQESRRISNQGPVLYDVESDLRYLELDDKVDQQGLIIDIGQSDDYPMLDTEAERILRIGLQDLRDDSPKKHDKNLESIQRQSFKINRSAKFSQSMSDIDSFGDSKIKEEIVEQKIDDKMEASGFKPLNSKKLESSTYKRSQSLS
jgi:hypothetical protein